MKLSELKKIIKEEIKLFLKEEKIPVPIIIRNNKEAIEACNQIIGYNTLPPQIDYTTPYRIKSDKAEKYLKDNFKPRELKIIYDYIADCIHDYSASGAAHYDSLF